MASIKEPNFDLDYGWALGESGWNVGMDANLKKIGAFMMITVLSATTIAEPLTPTSGDRYIMPVGATGTNWAGQDGKAAVFNIDTWEFYDAVETWKIRAVDSQQTYIYNSAAWVLESTLLGQYADDTAAGVGLVPVDGFYINSSTGALTVRLV